MLSGKLVTFSIYLMISFNLLLAFAAVWSFQRMSPEIRRVYKRNVVSLEACENMFGALAGGQVDMEAFRKALAAAENNITEQGEKEALTRIRNFLPALAEGKDSARRDIAGEIRNLSFCNRQAIIASGERTQKMRRAGGWVIVFMTFFFFTAALLFVQKLRKTLLEPLEELNSVLEAKQKGDPYRRCNGNEASGEMKKIFRAVNMLLDNSREK